MREARILRTAGGQFLLHDQYNLKQISAVARKKIKQEAQLFPGDIVNYSLQEQIAVIEGLKPRKNLLLRPKVANIDCLAIVIGLKKPGPDFLYLDKLLCYAEWLDIDSIIILNKIDIGIEQAQKFFDIYQSLNYAVFKTSALLNQGLSTVKEALAGRITVFVGPSGVGKSTLLNRFDLAKQLITRDVSQKIGRGRHTTKHVELFSWGQGYVTDTPGFSQLYLQEVNLDYLTHSFREFRPYLNQCHFSSCTHDHEPNCAIKNAVKEQRISDIRYQNYISIKKELKQNA